MHWYMNHKHILIQGKTLYMDGVARMFKWDHKTKFMYVKQPIGQQHAYKNKVIANAKNHIYIWYHIPVR